MKASYFVLFLLIYSNFYSQLYDSFSDGDFISNPAWSGNTGDWEIIQNNSSGINGTGTTNTIRLSVVLPVSGTKYLSSQRNGSWGSEQSWSFWLGRRSGSAASSDNQSIVWLWANESDLTSNTVDGYRIIFGKSGSDNIALQIVTDGIAVSLVESDSSIISEADISFMVRVTRNNSSVWNLYSSVLPNTSGEGPASYEIPSAENTNILQGTITDETYTIFDNGYLGFMAKHTSGSSALVGAEFDQLYFDTDASSLLPVELLNFKAENIKGNVLLTWETATEINNYGFDVERDRTNLQGLENLGGFKKIAFINGHGNSNSPKYYSIEDKNIAYGKYFYRLKQIDFDGSYSYSEIILVEIYDNGNFRLNQNYPNPFNPDTKISFILPSSQNKIVQYPTILRIYDLLGNLIDTLINQELPAGKYEIIFNGSKLSSGIYYYILAVQNYIQAKKMLLIK